MAALLSGLLLVVALPPSPSPLLGAVALAPLAVAVGGVRPGPGAGMRAWGLGTLAGATAWAVLLRWIVPSLDLVHPLPLALAAWAAVVAFLAALAGVAALLLHRLHHRWRLPLVVALPVAWTGVEWLRAHLGDLSFPWLELAAALAERPELLAPAEWSGARGLTFWLAAAGGWVADRIVAHGGGAGGADGGPGAVDGAGAARPRAGPLAAAALLALLLAPAVWGAWRVERLERVLRPGPEVVVVGTDLPLGPPAAPAVAGGAERTALAVEAVLRAVRSLSTEEADELEGRGAPDLVVVPEAVVRLAGPEGRAARERLGAAAREAGAPLVAGAYLDGTEAGGSGAAPPANGAVLVDPAGEVRGVYEKRRLVPGVERAPFLAPSEGVGGFRRGREGTLVEVGPGPLRVGVLICFESLFGPLARAYRGAGADVLVALTDDAWLSPGAPGPAGSAAGRQHAAHLRLRAAETRTGVVRAANRGWSGVVDPLGRLAGPGIPQGSEGALRARVPTVAVRTPYVRWGDWLGGGSALLGLLALVGPGPAAWRRRLRRSAGSRPGAPLA